MVVLCFALLINGIGVSGGFGSMLSPEKFRVLLFALSCCLLYVHTAKAADDSCFCKVSTLQIHEFLKKW